MSRLAIKRFLIIALSAIMIFLTLMLAQEPISLVFTSCVVFFFVLGVFYRFDYLHPATAYLLPWLMILIFSILPISSYARRIDFATYELLLAGMFAWLLSCVGAPVGSGHDSLKNNDSPDNVFPRNAPATASFALTASIVFLFAFAALNVAFAGFVPILSLLSTGDSRYMEFGVPSVYGAYLAYANALGCVVFYLYLRTHRRKYLLVFISILIMHVIFITRQNMITLLVEAFAIRCLAVKRVSKITMVGFLAIALIVFSIIGGLRSGNIQEIIGIEPQFSWVPNSLLWLYAYSYFNALNIDNMIAMSGAPFFDGFMWQSLLPSMLRPENTHETFVELASVGLASYIYPIYMDIGKKGVIFFAGTMGVFTAIAYRHALESRRFVDIATYSCLFFCALLSFFTDFWLYLPVIFQIVFFRMFHFLLFRPRPKPRIVPVRPADSPEVNA